MALRFPSICSPQKASFKKSMRGYKARQVDSYIESLCTDFAEAEEDYQSKIVALEKEISRLQQQIAHCHDVEQENAKMREEIAVLRANRLHLIRRIKATTHHKKTEKKPLSQEEKTQRTQQFFRSSAEVIRLVGHTGQKVSRIARVLPTANKKKEIPPMPATAKEAKKYANKLYKQEKKRSSAEKKINKARKIEQKQLKKLEKLT